MERAMAKVPAVTLGFWIVKILATTLGETGGDTLSMTFDFGYLVSTAIFAAVLIVFIAVQIAAKKFHPLLYWATIVASTTAGTTLSDFATRSLGIGYQGGALLLFACVMLSLAAWYWSEGSVSVATVSTPRVEWHYWVTITFSQTLGTALGDWVAAPPGDVPPGMGFGYETGAVIFGSGLVVLALLYFLTPVSRVFLFWSAFILTRPLGATIGDFFDKPVASGGLNVSRPLASAILAVVIVVLIFVLPQRAGTHPAGRESGET
ncbi:MAG: hypothetical protein JOZ13_09910 [Alphaproteobacteria bacterium]|nr:hypothetical protein [Alphaproteobacteria bacterium]